jgi:uncharacterized protein
MRWAATLFNSFAILWFLSLIAVAQPKFPPLSGRVVDEAGLLSAGVRAQIEQDLRDLEGRSSDQVVVYITRSLQGYPIEDFGYQLGRAWKIGQASGNNGVLLIVAPNERKVRIEVGRGLEGQMTDLMSKLIIDNAILPAFRRGDFAAGVQAGAKDIKDVLLGDAEAVKERAKWGKKRSGPSGDTLTSMLPLLFLLLFIWIVWSNAQQQKRLPTNMQRKRRLGDGNVIIIPGGWGSAGGWGSSGGGWSSGGSGDGGFSGGGGDFGGGGSSGSW